MEQKITEDNFAQVISTPGVVLVDFWAPWCGPCRSLAPVVEEIAEKYAGRAVVAKCDVDECENVAATCGIRTIPTLIYYKDGQAVQRSSGLVSGVQISSVLDSLL